MPSSSKTPKMDKGARCLADVSPAFLAKLNRGQVETRTLSEWLAVDLVVLTQNVYSGLNLGRPSASLLDFLKSRSDVGIIKCLDAIGAALFELSPNKKERSTLRKRLRAYPCDVVREFASRSLKFESELSWDEFLRELRPLAADSNMSVREGAWMALRPRVSAAPAAAIEKLLAWASDKDPNVRRCAIEATRPRGVWCNHVLELKSNPAIAIKLLSAVRQDESDYVLRSAANWLNDASKSCPDWVKKIAEDWRKAGEQSRTEKLLKHAFRTLRGKTKK